MTLFRALTIQSGVTTQIQPGNTLAVGAGIDADSAGALAIGQTAGGTATSISLNQNTSMPGAQTFSTGTGTVTVQGSVTTASNPNFDFSGSTGTFNTSTGNNTLEGSTTLAAGKNFTAAAGAGNFNFSSSTGSFQTSSGAVSVNGNTTFTGSTTVTVAAFATAGIVHNAAGGLFSSSLIVNADIDSAAAIAVSKLASGSDGQFLVTNTATPTWTTASGDATLTGAGAFTVTAIQHNPVANTLLDATEDGYVLTWNHTAGWAAEPISSATAITLSGDVTGPSNANTVVKINGASVPVSGSLVTGNVLQVSGSAALTYAAINLAGGSNYVTGNLPVTNVAPGTDTQILQTNGSTPTWVTFSQDATVADSGVVTVVSAHGSFTVATGLTVTSGGATITAGDLTVSSGNASVSGTTTATGGVLTNSVDTATAGTLNLGTTTATKVQLGTVGHLTEVLGDFKVDGAETIVGTSSFQSNATFQGNVTIDDGYTLTVNTITSNASNDLTLEGATGFIDVPSGMTLRATGYGQIIATSSSATTTLNSPFTTGAVATGSAVYVSSNDTVTAADSAAIATSYVVGFVSSSGEVATDGLVTAVAQSGSATAGQVMYLDTGANAGKVTATAPSTGVIAPVGFMKNTTDMIIRVLTPVVL